jgi:hypothetical protein
MSRSLSLGPCCFAILPPSIRCNHIHGFSSVWLRTWSLGGRVMGPYRMGLQHVVFPPLAQSSHGHMSHMTYPCILWLYLLHGTSGTPSLDSVCGYTHPWCWLLQISNLNRISEHQEPPHVHPFNLSTSRTSIRSCIQFVNIYRVSIMGRPWGKMISFVSVDSLVV